MEEVIQRLERIESLLQEMKEEKEKKERISEIRSAAGKKSVVARHKKGILFEQNILCSNKSENSSVHDLIAAYCDAYKEKYGGNPVITGKTVGLAKNVLKAVSIERARNLIAVYLQTDDDWFKKVKHRFSDFYANLEQLGASLEVGQPLSSSSNVDLWLKQQEAKDE